MSPKARTKQILLYLFTPEDSTEIVNAPVLIAYPPTPPSLPPWLGTIKTIIWTTLAIILTLALTSLCSG
jgi:hypothetical protein